MKELVLITAMGYNQEIGKDNQLLCSLKDDLRLFRMMTEWKTVIMGRKTFESIGKPLTNRMNIVLTRDTDYQVEDVVVAHSIEEVKDLLENIDGEAFIIGGQEIYREFLLLANKMVITRIEGSFDDADTFFPQVNWEEWEESREPWYFMRNAVNEYSFSHCLYNRKTV